LCIDEAICPRFAHPYVKANEPAKPTNEIRRNSMYIKIMTLTAVLALAAGSAFAQPASPDAQPNSGDIRELNKDIHNNEGDLRKDAWDAGHDQRDINRDDSLRNADLQREQRDMRDGDASGANYWRRQAKDENAEISHDQRDLAHSRSDIHNDKMRLAKDFKVRRHDAGKLNSKKR
jgi:hypothetical protein